MRSDSALPARHLAGVLAVVAGTVALVVSTEVFPYHSLNHDEGVYLQQAAMLLEGKLVVRPPVPEAVRPWFFVADGARLYPKYAPVPAAVFAAGELLGGYRLALAGVAAATVALTHATVAEVFDPRTGLLAATLLLASPFFLVQSGVFLPYLPTLALALLFAWAYLRAHRTGSRRLAAVAGVAVGLAFFARPFDTLLFAAPFVGHALWTLRTLDRPVLLRQGVTAALGLAGVGVTLGYNALVTGDPTTFPYLAFAPEDGLGFGYRRILGYDRVYSVALALEANARVLGAFVSRWAPLAPVGVPLAALGVGALARARDRVDARTLALAGLFLTIPLGQVAFWGNLNILGDLGRPGDGLMFFLGPYYHTGLLVPTAAFGAVGVLALGGRVRSLLAGRTTGLRLAAGGVLAVVVVLAGGVAVGTATGPLAANGAVTDRYEPAYEPVEDHALDDALVYLPPLYGDWLNHPLQALRNDPDFDEGPVYALQDWEFETLSAHPDRRLYRYAVRGEWNPTAGDGVDARLQRLRHVEGRLVDAEVALGVPRYARSLTLQVESEADRRTRGIALAGNRTTFRVRTDGETATVTGPGLAGPVTVPVAERETLELRTFVDYGTTSSFSYRVALPLNRTADGVEALTPALEVCRAPQRCDGEAAYIPGTHRPDVTMEATLE
jgi:hypothetical protein